MRRNNFSLVIQMLLKFGAGFLIMAVILFSSAGSMSYINGWLFILALAIPMAIFGTFLLVKDPTTLERRLRSKETEKKQSQNIVISGLLFITLFLISGLDYRFSWSQMPVALVVIALITMLLGYMMFIAVILQNTYASRVVEVVDNQKIITSGLYSIVRHPMYTASITLFLSIPFVLGSYYALIPMLFYPLIIVRRIKQEEQLLAKELDGYIEYTNRTKYRLIPFVW